MSISASCLDDGWQHPAVAWAAVNKDFEPSLQKANTFMASKSRLDDQPRMMKVKEVGHKKFEVGSFSVNERERMLGYPDGYVMRAGKTGIFLNTSHSTKRSKLTCYFLS